MFRPALPVVAAMMATTWTVPVSAQSVCGGEVLFQCATDDPDAREQITVCARGESYILARHVLSSGEMIYDPPLIADANTTWFHWSEEDQAQLEIGFWSTDLGEPVTLYVHMPWDDMNETVAENGASDMWLQSPHWRTQVDQVTCASDTVYAEPERLWPAQAARGPIGAFFSQDDVIPRIDTVGVAQVTEIAAESEGAPVYASARPSAATPVWWMLQSGDTVDILDRLQNFIAVAIPTNGMKACLIRPEQLGMPYSGPCATGWVDAAFLDPIQ
ncbi:hypothetical protein [Celeribacter sp.]|uniref:hypothetical protein n=1 Tax=Celeribacter sp. TaxID=1890673 RepID=UPI003A9005C5